MTPDHTSIDTAALAAHCPLCGAANQCAVAAGTDPEHCWCTRTSIDADARRRALKAGADDRCLCRYCGAPRLENSP